MCCPSLGGCRWLDFTVTPPSTNTLWPTPLSRYILRTRRKVENRYSVLRAADVLRVNMAAVDMKAIRRVEVPAIKAAHPHQYQAGISSRPDTYVLYVCTWAHNETSVVGCSKRYGVELA